MVGKMLEAAFVLMALVSLLTFPCTVAALSPRSTGTGFYEVPVLTLEELMDDASANSVQKALAIDGMLQVSRVPGLAARRRAALTDAVQCSLEIERLPKATLSDGSTRNTFASGTRMGKSYHLGLRDYFRNSALPEACQAFEKSSYQLRELVTRTSNLFFSQLDHLCGVNQGSRAPFALNAKPHEPHYDTVFQFLNHGEHLEHFHIYDTNCSQANDNTKSLHMHTDEGLFISIVPPLWSTNANVLDMNPSEGFYVETPSGEIQQPRWADNGDVLVFLMGEGTGGWFGQCSPMRSVPHSLVLADSCGSITESEKENALRSWYGRMFMPPRDALHEASMMSFEEKRARDIKALEGEEEVTGLPFGCSSGRRLQDEAEECNSNSETFWCWMSCQNIFEVSNCSRDNVDQVQCYNIVEEKEHTDEAEHCFDCIVTCEDSPEPNTEGICNGIGTSMYMGGFESGLNAASACVVLLFQPFRLDTIGNFVLGVVGTFLFGIVVEALIWFRKKNAKSAVQRSPFAEKSIYMLLYLTQVTFGYLAMLVAMTYSTILFATIVAGLGTGHFLFNMSAKKGEKPGGNTSDPCCQFMEDVNDDSGSRKSVQTKPGNDDDLESAPAFLDTDNDNVLLDAKIADEIKPCCSSE